MKAIKAILAVAISPMLKKPRTWGIVTKTKLNAHASTSKPTRNNVVISQRFVLLMVTIILEIDELDSWQNRVRLLLCTAGVADKIEAPGVLGLVG